MQSWDLIEVDAPAGTRDPLVVHSGNEARAVLIGLHAGQSLGEHQVKESLFLVVLKGNLRITSGSESLDAAPGTLVTFEPGERHSVSSVDGGSILLLFAPWPGEGHYRGGAQPPG